MKKVKQQINTMISQEEKELEKKRTARFPKLEDSMFLSGYIAGLNKALTIVEDCNLELTKE